MAEPVDLEILRFAMVAASVIVFGGWMVAAGLGVLLVRRQVRAIRERAGGVLPAPESMALLLYALSVFFWPAGFALGLYFLSDPKTTLQGRNCLYIGIGYLTLITGLTCLGMALLGVISPETLAFIVS